MPDQLCSRYKMTTLWGWCLFIYFRLALLTESFPNLEIKGPLLQDVAPENPKCFAEGMHDLTCFWEEENGGPVEQYMFLYMYPHTNRNTKCELTTQPARGTKTWYICSLPNVQHFTPLDISVLRNGLMIHNRTLFVDQVFLLDPPTNVTVVNTGKQGQLRLSWLPPPIIYMEEMMIYEVSYTAIKGQQREQIVHTTTKVVLRNLQLGTTYDIQVRVKPDGISYNGYWSPWSSIVSMSTPPADLDPLILSLCLIISFIFLVFFVILFLSHRRFLLKKMWPMIPSPDNKFPGLFTIHAGNFKEWLGYSNGDLWWRPGFLLPEERTSPLEVLSEVRRGPPIPARSKPAVPASKEEAPSGSPLADLQQQWAMEQLWVLPPPYAFGLPPLQSIDSYVTLNHSCHPSGEKDVLGEESAPLQLLFTSPGTPHSHSDLGSRRHSSGCVSSHSSLEYPSEIWAPKEPPYACATVTDSAISMDYSPMSSANAAAVYANDYRNEFPIPKIPHLGQSISSGW